MPRRTIPKKARESTRNWKSSTAGTEKSLDFGLFGPVPDEDFTETADLAKELRDPQASSNYCTDGSQASANASDTLYQYTSPDAYDFSNCNNANAEIVETKRQISSLRDSIIEVRPQSAAKLLTDMLSAETYDLSSFSDDTPQLKPALPLAFRDLLQPHEASELYAAMSTPDVAPPSSPSWYDMYTHREAHPVTNPSQNPETFLDAAAVDNVTAVHSQKPIPNEASATCLADQTVKKQQPFRFAAACTSCSATKLATAAAHSQCKNQQQPASPHTPLVVDVVTQQCRKRSIADITDAHVMAEDWVRGKKRCKVPGSEDVHAAVHSDKRRRCIDLRSEHRSGVNVEVKIEPSNDAHVGDVKGLARPKRKREHGDEQGAGDEQVGDSSGARKRSKAHNSPVEEGPSEALAGASSAGRTEAEPLKNNQLVWAKCLNWPYWPARVVELTPEERQAQGLAVDDVCVEFFDDLKSVTHAKLRFVRAWLDTPKEAGRARGREDLRASVARAKKALKDDIVSV